MYDLLKKKDYIYSGKLGSHIADFIAEKRAFGCLYNTEAKKLSEFSRMTMKYDFTEDTLTQEVVEAWLTRRPTDADKTVYSRFSIIRGFADYMVRHGYDAYIPSSADLSLLHTTGYVPYVFTHEEIERFFAVYRAEREFKTAYCARLKVMMQMIFELLYCCGLRMSEATNLKSEDVDLTNGILTVRFAKFEKSRYVPISPDVATDLKEYMDSYIHEPFLFPGRTGQHLDKNSVYNEFRHVLLAAGIPHYGRGKGPRVHDFRHTFACHCLHRWIKNGIPVSSALPRLSTYLGHSDITATEKYIHMTAEVYPEISEKLSREYGHLIPKEVQS